MRDGAISGAAQASCLADVRDRCCMWEGTALTASRPLSASFRVGTMTNNGQHKVGRMPPRSPAKACDHLFVAELTASSRPRLTQGSKATRAAVSLCPSPCPARTRTEPLAATICWQQDQLIQQLQSGSKGQANMGSSTAGQDGLLGALLGCCCGAAGMGEELYK